MGEAERVNVGRQRGGGGINGICVSPYSSDPLPIVTGSNPNSNSEYSNSNFKYRNVGTFFFPTYLHMIV